MNIGLNVPDHTTLSRRNSTLPNKATIEELRGIEGVGFVRALEIVEYRDRFGPYRNLEELGLIRGVGSQTLRALRENYEVH